VQHNRYFVMRKFIDLAGVTAENNIAQRMKLEIQIEDLQDKIRDVIEVLYYTNISTMHPSLRELFQ